MEIASFVPGAEEQALPSGVVAFLFTDIEGSTLLWERDSDAMQRDVQHHDRIMRTAIDANDGHVFKTIGDAFCAAFWNVDDALRAAVAAQRALAIETFVHAGGLRVRMAIHSGASDERDYDYFGPALNRVARLLAIGHGGQILLSKAASEAVVAMPPSISLRDCGEHRLKDLNAPERVFQVVAPDLNSEFPELRSLGQLTNNLPIQVTTLVGREADVADIQTLLASSRLVTLLGTGGLGKTRCALQVAAETIEQYPDGAWFVDLAPLADPSLVPNAIARIFDVQEPPSHSIRQTLAVYFKHKKMLLVLDNCEHVIAEASKTAASLLSSCPHLKILTTSRESLNIAGETVFRVPTLAVPVRSRTLVAGDARAYSAVSLLEARARASNPRFEVTDDNVFAIVDICRRLDGIPLAIELAAARLKVLTPRELSAKLDERFRLLTGGDRAALPRQQTMRALIGWSYDLLDEREQALFRRVSIFAGGFTLEAAIDVCGDDAVESYEVLDLLSSLVDKSLVVADASGDVARYGMLESTREFAMGERNAHDESPTASQRHASYYAGLAEQLEDEYETISHAMWLARAEPETENLRAAMRWSFSEGGDAIVGERIAATLPRLFGVVAAAEGRRWVKTALERIDAQTPARVIAGLHLADAALASFFNQFGVALASAQRALERFIELGDTRGIAEAQRIAGRSLVYLGKVDEGERLLQDAFAHRLARGSTRVGGTLRDLAVARAMNGDIEGARMLCDQANHAFEEDADESNRAITAATLAEAEFLAGDACAALGLAREALGAVRRLGRSRTAAAILGNIAAYEIALERYDDARASAREALELARESQVDVSVFFALQHLAAIAALRPNPDRERAARLAGYVEHGLHGLDVVREYTERQEYEKLMSSLRGAEAARVDAWLMVGARWQEEHAIAEALAI